MVLLMAPETPQTVREAELIAALQKKGVGAPMKDGGELIVIAKADERSAIEQIMRETGVHTVIQVI